MKINIKMNKAMFNDAYLPLLFDYEDRYKVFYGGGGSGKPHFVFQRMVIKALKDKRKILVIRKVGATLKDSVWRMCLDTLGFFGIKDLCIINKSTFTIELPNGSSFLFKGLDDPEKIKKMLMTADEVNDATQKLALLGALSLYLDFINLFLYLLRIFGKRE